MEIVFAQGGLGKQLFQYTFFQYLLKKEKRRVYMDAMLPFISKHDGFEMKRIFPDTTDERIKPLSATPTGNFVFTIPKDERPLFSHKKYLEKN